MGWGSAKSDASLADDDLPHVDEPPEDFSDQDFWRWVRGHTDWNLLDGAANPLANSFALSQGVAWQGRGMPSFAGIAGKRAAEPTLRFAVRATRAAGGLAAVSAASTYYRRPVARADGRAEPPSLFMPYWQAGLSPVAAAERQQAWRRQGAPR